MVDMAAVLTALESGRGTVRPGPMEAVQQQAKTFLRYMRWMRWKGIEEVEMRCG